MELMDLCGPMVRSRRLMWRTIQVERSLEELIILDKLSVITSTQLAEITDSYTIGMEALAQSTFLGRGLQFRLTSVTTAKLSVITRMTREGFMAFCLRAASSSRWMFRFLVHVQEFLESTKEVK